jgi:Sulfate permease family
MPPGSSHGRDLARSGETSVSDTPLVDPRTWAAPKPSGIRRFVPILEWLPRYDRGWLRFDVIAGATVWGLSVPESIAYAGLAGLAPQAGLYTLLVTLAAYAVFGTSRHLVAAATSAAAVLLASSVGGLARVDRHGRVGAFQRAAQPLGQGTAHGRAVCTSRVRGHCGRDGAERLPATQAREIAGGAAGSAPLGSRRAPGRASACGPREARRSRRIGCLPAGARACRRGGFLRRVHALAGADGNHHRRCVGAWA